MAGAPWSVRVFMAGALGVATGLLLLSLEAPGADLLTQAGLLAATPSAALIAFRRAKVSTIFRRLAAAYLWLVFFAPFAAVGFLLVVGGDPLATFLTVIVGFAWLLVQGLLVAATLAVHSGLRRRAAKTAG